MSLTSYCSLYCNKNFTMKASNSSASNYKLRGLVTWLYRYRVCSTSNSSHGYPNHDRRTSYSSKFCYVPDGISSQRGLNMFGVKNGSLRTPEAIMARGITEKVQPSVPAPPRPNYLVWVKWVLGTLMPVILGLWKQKWNNLLKLEGEVEEVEKVAEVVEKVSSEVAEALNDGRLKEAALMVEHVSSVTAKDAQLTKHFVDKVADLKQDLKDLQIIAHPLNCK